MNGKFDWIVSESAPREYPMFVISGLATLADGKVALIPDRRMVNNGWGELGSVQLYDEEFRAVPKKLDLAWYSLIEDAYYKASIDLPEDAIRAAFNTKVVMPGGEQVEFNRVMFGMAPGGDVAIWVGADRVVREIGMYRAATASFELSDMANDPDQTKQQFVGELLAAALKPDELQRVRSRAVPAGRWREYDTRFNWAPQNSKGDVLWLTTLNGETNWLDLTGKRKPGTSANGQLAAPYKIEMTWKTPAGEGRLGEISFDPEETAQAFRAMAQRGGNGGAMQLILDPAETLANVEILLRKGDEVYRFSKAKVEVSKM